MGAFDWALFALRAGAGLILVAHGLNAVKTRDFATKRFATNGFKYPNLQWYASVSTQIGAGILLIIGLLTSVAAAGLIAVMFEAFWTVHRTRGFFIFKPGVGWEFVALLGLVGFVIATLGPGEGSIDHALGIAVDLDGAFGFSIGVWGLALAVAHLIAFYRPSTASKDH